MLKTMALLALFVLSGCASLNSDEEDLRTVPVTNNPYVVPNHGGAVPGMSLGGAGGPQ